ncbi:MAG: hypothetical protein AAF360_10215, partial [Pseudomonadota bacterium]
MVDATITHLRGRGFGRIIAAGPGAASLGEDADDSDVYAFTAKVHDPAQRAKLLNNLIDAHRGEWLLVCFNGEFFFHPFCDTRSVRDLIEFMWSERRDAVMNYAIDLYNDDMTGEAFNREMAYFDAEGWYGFERGEKLADVYGGLGWRFEEFTPRDMSRVNRPALFWADPAVPIRGDLWFE